MNEHKKEDFVANTAESSVCCKYLTHLGTEE